MSFQHRSLDCNLWRINKRSRGATKNKKREADKVSGEVIPTIMQEMNISSLKLADGSAVEVKPVYGASIPIAKKEKHLNGFVSTA